MKGHATKNSSKLWYGYEYNCDNRDFDIKQSYICLSLNDHLVQNEAFLHLNFFEIYLDNAKILP